MAGCTSHILLWSLYWFVVNYFVHILQLTFKNWTWSYPRLVNLSNYKVQPRFYCALSQKNKSQICLVFYILSVLKITY